MTLRLRWDGGWTWTCGSESGAIRARDPLDASAEIRVLARRLRAVELEVEGISEYMHVSLAYLTGHEVSA